MKIKKKKKSSSTGTESKKTKKLSKAEIRAAKRAAKKGDGSFPDILIVRKDSFADGSPVFYAADGATMDGLNIDGQSVGVYKLRRASKMKIVRKIER